MALFGLLSGADFFNEPTERRPNADAEVALLRMSRSAMATTFEVLLPLGQTIGTAACADALDLIDEMESQLTVYRVDSEVSRLNRTAFREDVVVEEGLFDLLMRSAGLWRETGGAFDAAAGALIKAWGFYRRSGMVPTVATRAEAMRRTGMRHVALDPERRTVRYRVDGLEINFGGIGKGYALDRAAQLLRERWNVSAALVHGGSSSVVALGSPTPAVPGWTVAIRHPWDERRILGTVRLRDGALGTSAATYQYFEYNGRKLGHLLDPRRGWPAEGIQQVSVIAPTAAEADAMSTAFYVMGVAETERFCRSHPHLGAIIVPDAGAKPMILNLDRDAFTAADS